MFAGGTVTAGDHVSVGGNVVAGGGMFAGGSMFATGKFELRDADSNVKVEVFAVDPRWSGGSIGLRGADGTRQIHMFVDASNEGFIFADVKSFRIPNPNDAGTDITYACIEGPEAGCYIRGTGRLEQGRGSISLPDHFRAVARAEEMTVHLTPLSPRSHGLAVVEKSLGRVVVRELAEGTGNYRFDWLVMCVRKGYEDYRVIRPSTKLGRGQALTYPTKNGARPQGVPKTEAAALSAQGLPQRRQVEADAGDDLDRRLGPDSDRVTRSTVQGLHALVEAKGAELAEPRQEIAALHARLAKVETLVAKLAESRKGADQ